MGFDPNKKYEAYKIDYLNIVLAFLLALIAIIWAIN